jgi:hypothetical protein
MLERGDIRKIREGLMPERLVPSLIRDKLTSGFFSRIQFVFRYLNRLEQVFLQFIRGSIGLLI